MLLKPIFITGASRSGTSMTAGIINMCGAWGGDFSFFKGKTRFENEGIVNKVEKKYLIAIGADPMGQDPLPANAFQYTEKYNSEFIKYNVISIIVEQGYKDPKIPLMYKGAKMCLNWAAWHNAFLKAKWVLVRRKKEDIINSCMKTSFMRAFDNPKDWGNWVDVYEKRFSEMKIAGLELREVWPQKMINGDYSEIEEVIKWLGLEWKEQLVKEFISPELWGKGVEYV